MSSIRDAITRVARSVRKMELSRAEKVVEPLVRSNALGVPKIIEMEDRSFSKNELKEFRPLITDYQRKRYKDFLLPLKMPNLKTFNHSTSQFDERLAKSNWVKKRSKDPYNVLEALRMDRQSFEIMINYLVEITPEHLKLKLSNNQNILNSIMVQQEEQDQQNKFPITKHVFDEIPPMPHPLTKESFQKYIYRLTHLKYYYRNSLSLENGIIPEILLHTHKLSNDEFKPYRSVHTYNYLIKFFGYDKNQSSFAREMLLVMNKDGHKPNTDTINSLLKLCQIHSHIRSTTNTYQIIMKYLKLSQILNIEINLTTYNRVYDSISNIFLKEIFLNRIASIPLPVLRNLILRIIDDYLKTTTDTKQLTTFIEDDLGTNWQEDGKIFNKLVLHKGINLSSNQQITELVQFALDNNPDQYTIKYLMEGVVKNSQLKDKMNALMIIYAKTSRMFAFSEVPVVYRYLMSAIIKSDYPISIVIYLIRGLVYDSTTKLGLPVEIIRYGSYQTQPENYRIVKRIVGFDLCRIEAQMQPSEESSGCRSRSSRSSRQPWSASSSSSSLDFVLWAAPETKQWTKLLSELAAIDPHLSSLVEDILKSLQIKGPNPVSQPAQKRYLQQQKANIAHARARDRLNRLEKGSQLYIEHQLSSRNLVEPSR
ncbi:uncharacterized protein PRCAT00004059001 [Priceomyces carsonii]|uniref:uncharacterized protein n=1 Tax=Priceomyces carsonii TaxID=28549 RepID=UPI002ED78443|nr:unnamed protein product [Priceomyces carsonii]